MLTSEQLRSIMPRLTAARISELLPFLTAAMSEFAIDAPARAAAFLAQLAHESGQFRFMQEIWGPTDAQKRYEPVTKLSQALGNIDAGDGKLFKGRGPIQLTGRANYKRFGDLLGVDLIADPARAANPDVGFRAAGLFWSKHGLNELADAATDDAFVMITKRINGGTNGLPDRQALYAVARRVLGVPDAPRTRGALPDAAPVEDTLFDRGAEAIRRHEGRAPVRPAPAAKARKTAAKTKRAAKTVRTRSARPKPKTKAKKGGRAATTRAAARKKAARRKR